MISTILQKDSEEPVKDMVVGVRCDSETKAELERIAFSLDTRVSNLVFRMIKKGINFEEERSKKIREVLQREGLT